MDVHKIRQEFEILNQKVHNKPLVYLDSAATTLKPRQVSDAIRTHYALEASNVHRGVHLLSEKATIAFEEARSSCQRFLGAEHSEEIIFTAGTTAGMNTIANSLGQSGWIGAGDKILVSEMEHHSNIVPWQMLAERVGAQVEMMPMTQTGDLDLERIMPMFDSRVKLMAVTMVSNAIGTINPLQDLISAAKRQGAYVVLDGAQAVSHFKVDVKALGCDFLCFSGHKLFGPTGVGVMFGRKEILEGLPPVFGGGGMIRTVSFSGTTYAELPEKFEAGTPHIAGAIGLGEAIKFVEAIGFDAIEKYENDLLSFASDELSKISGLTMIGTARSKVPVFSFKLEGAHPHDIGTILDQEGVAIRAGHHCCQPLMKFYQVPATSRASLAFYNTTEEVEALVKAIDQVKEVFK